MNLAKQNSIVVFAYCFKKLIFFWFSGCLIFYVLLYVFMDIDIWAALHVLHFDYTVAAAAIKKQEEIAVFIQRIEALKTELEIEQQQGASLRQKLEVATKVEQEKIKLQIEVR